MSSEFLTCPKCGFIYLRHPDYEIDRTVVQRCPKAGDGAILRAATKLEISAIPVGITIYSPPADHLLADSKRFAAVEQFGRVDVIDREIEDPWLRIVVLNADADRLATLTENELLGLTPRRDVVVVLDIDKLETASYHRIKSLLRTGTRLDMVPRDDAMLVAEIERDLRCGKLSAEKSPQLTIPERMTALETDLEMPRDGTSPQPNSPRLYTIPADMMAAGTPGLHTPTWFIERWREKVSYASADATAALIRMSLPSPSFSRTPHAAVEIAAKNGWRLALPMETAKYLLGMGERPNEIDVFPFNQPEPLDFPTDGVHFVPAGDPSLFGLTAASQCLRLALPQDVSEASLVEIGEIAGHAAIATSGHLLEMFRRDLAFNLLREPEQIVAETILRTAEEAKGSAMRRAPVEFVPPPADEAPRLINWRVLRHQTMGYQYLAAEYCIGHPHIAPDDRHFTSSKLVWIDEGKGWARTASRYYRIEAEQKSQEGGDDA